MDYRVVTFDDFDSFHENARKMHYESMRAQLQQAHADLARLTAERDAAIQRAERAERRLDRLSCRDCENRRISKSVDPEGWRDLEMGSVECDKHRALVEACEGGDSNG